MTVNANFTVLIPDGEETYALSVVRCLSERKNIQIFVLGQDKYDSIRFSRHISKYIHQPHPSSEEERLQLIENVIRDLKPDILLPVGVRAIRLISGNRDRFLQLTTLPPLPEVASFDIADDKWLLSRWLLDNELPHPNTLLFTANDKIQDIIPNLTFPIIIKPRNGWGGNGIKIFREVDEFQAWHAEFEHEENLIIQSYIQGYDIDCSILAENGKILGYTIQKSIKYSIDYPWPYGLEFLYNDEIHHVVTDLAQKFNWSGIVHIDLRYDEVEKRAKVIEMNPRFWASVTASVFAGVNFPYLSCVSALRQSLPPIHLEHKIVVRTGPAIKLYFNKIFKKEQNLLFDNTFLEFIIKDPLPTIIGESLEYYQKKIKKNLK